MKKHVKDELYCNGMYSNQVSDLLLWHFEDHKEAAEYFGVTPQTVKNWVKKGNWPLSVVRLLLIMHRGYLPITKPWRGFKIRGDRMFTPGGRELTAYDLMELDIRVSLKNHTNVIQFRRKKKKRYKIKKQGVKRPAKCT
ncbi:DUF3653 domain-containing protein [Vibrio rotiferianus]|jgi:hypothetical protein|uniref:DUF3653 domain-containing protein n=1 Tax=Vibrio rotiferianus TaxID=190895 RepID=UPI00406A2493